MKKEEVDIALEWEAIEGWNPGLYDSRCFYDTDPHGFFIAFLDNEPIGCISAVSYGKSFGFIGFHIVRPEFRKKGYGTELWKTAMEYLKDRNVGLDGIPSRQQEYEKLGFRLAYRNARYQGVGPGKKPAGPHIVPLSHIPLNEVAAYDDKSFPVPRHRFIKCWIDQPESVALGIIIDRRLSGYGVLRTCRNGFKIGPLFADDVSLAEELLETLIGNTPAGKPVFIDIPETNPPAVGLAQKKGMQKMFETARMYNRESPKIQLDRVFGVTSFELG